MILAIFVDAMSNDMSVVVDVPGLTQVPAGVGRDKGVEVSHYSTTVEEGTRVVERRRPDYLVVVVDAPGYARGTTGQRAQVGHPLDRAVEEGMPLSVATYTRAPDPLVGIVDVKGYAESSP